MQTIMEVSALACNVPAAISFLQRKDILKREVDCSICGGRMQKVIDKSRRDGCLLRCYRCKKMLSIRHDSFLSRSKLTITQSLLFIYLWSIKIPPGAIATMLGISEQTTVDWCNLIREVCSSKFMSEENPSLGGPGCVVQIDESVIYKPKYHRGHALVEPSKWIFGLYDTAKRIGVVELVENRSADVLLPLITKHVKPGTEIHSDQWAAYAGISSIDVSPLFIHKTVNHSLHFKDPSTGVHTNNVEAYWCSIKRKFKMLNGTSRMLTPSYLDEHMYRERYGRTNNEMFTNILDDIGRLGF